MGKRIYEQTPEDVIKLLGECLAGYGEASRNELISLLQDFTERNTSYSDELITERAVETAIARGWKPPRWVTKSTPDALLADADQFIFKHDFARALWGEDFYSDGQTVYYKKEPGTMIVSAKFSSEPAWQYHLQKMVVAKDPIKYLGQNI